MCLGCRAKYLAADRKGRYECAAQVRALETRQHAVLAHLGSGGGRALKTLCEDGILVLVVEARDVADEPSSSALGLVDVAAFVQPDGRLGQEKQDREPESQEDKLGVEGLAEAVWVGLCISYAASAQLKGQQLALLMMSKAIAHASWPSAKKKA